MIVAYYSTVRNSLKDYCDKVSDENETVIITRKDEKNVVLISLEEYNAMVKAEKRAIYLDMLDRSMEQLARGEGKPHELIEVDND